MGEAEPHPNHTPVKKNEVKTGQRDPEGLRAPGGCSGQPVLTGDAAGAVSGEKAGQERL